MTATSRLVVAVGVIVAACTDANRGTEPDPAPAPIPVIGSVRGTVDFAAGTLTFGPVEPRPGAIVGSAAVSVAIYGDQGLTVRIYHTAVVVTNPSAPGKKSFSADVGLRNLLAHSIGDEQGGPVPDDTTGVFVFMNGEPTVTRTSSACAPACTVTVGNAQGTMGFNGPNQAFWYWNDRLTAVGGLRDTTATRRNWRFVADSQVTGFTFDVLVSAAWPPPHQTRWKVEFSGDSLPHTTAEPDWHRFALLAGATVDHDAASPGSIFITVPSNGSHHFLRRDSVASTADAYLEARLKVNQGNPKPDIGFVIDDNVRSIAVGLSGTRVGFVDNTQAFIGTGTPVATTAFQTYRLRKFRADSVQLLMNGSRLASLPYTSFSPSSANTFSFFQFGTPGQAPGPNSSTWDHVIYEIGATQP